MTIELILASVASGVTWLLATWADRVLWARRMRREEK